MSSKREVPSLVRGVLDYDAKLTSAICNMVSKILPTRKFNTYYKGLEVRIYILNFFLINNVYNAQ